jgi:hypothetical protein
MIQKQIRELLRVWARHHAEDIPVLEIAIGDAPEFRIEFNVVRRARNSAVMTGVEKTMVKAAKRIGPVKALRIFTQQLNSMRSKLDSDAAVAKKANEDTRPISSFPFVVVRQEPVGHGGFHTGVLGSRNPEFRWVYDCGSW